MNLREIILAAPDLKRQPVEVPEWVSPDGKPVTVWVSMLSAASRSEWSEDAFDEQGDVRQKALRSRLLVRCLVNEAGEQIFSADDVDALEQKNSEVITRLFLVAKQLNGMGASAVDDAEKN